MRNTILRIAYAALFACLGAGAYAHGVATPKHGGLTDIGGETTFELVTVGQTVNIFVEDHGKPVDTKGATGELLLGSETGKRIAVLKGSGGNRLNGKATPPKRGDRVFVRVTFGNGSVEVGEFKIP